jgi:Basic region leucine zipper
MDRSNDSSDNAQQLLVMSDDQAQALAFAVAALQALPQSTRISDCTLDKNSSIRTTATAVATGPAAAAQDEAHNDTANNVSCTSRELPHGKPGITTSSSIECSNHDEVIDQESSSLAALALVQRNRERNREHARKTRLRKKAHVAALQVKVQALQAERQALLQQCQQQCRFENETADTASIADILLHLSSAVPTAAATASANEMIHAPCPPATLRVLVLAVTKRTIPWFGNDKVVVLHRRRRRLQLPTQRLPAL